MSHSAPFSSPVIAILLIIALCSSPGSPHDRAISSTPVLTLHAHNDYAQAQPLCDALSTGAISIEIDIHLVGMSLLVGHDEEELSPDKTLQILYLDPLKKIIDDNGGFVYQADHPLLLLIDIKTGALPTYLRLKTILCGYESILTTYSAAGTRQGAISLIISGNRDGDFMLTEEKRFASYDGRLADLDRDEYSGIITLISDDWEKHFGWRGEAEMPAEDLAKLKQVVDAVHLRGKSVRFWKLPVNGVTQKETVWQILLDAGVDLINVDELQRYRNLIEK